MSRRRRRSTGAATAPKAAGPSSFATEQDAQEEARIDEGVRLARVIGDKHLLFMKNHGVLVTGDTVAQAYRRLYKLERVCRAQVLAMSTGKPLEVLSDDIVARVQAPAENDRHPSTERERLFFEAMMRILDREMPGYAD